jgi:hypothetical protein
MLAGLAAAVVAAPEADELERNRRLLDRWKSDPQHYNRLLHDLEAFYALPPERQAQLREVDRLMHEADPSTQDRLWGVLERYAQWLERLPEGERRLVLEAPSREHRLVTIRGLKQQQWLDRLPATMRENLLKLKPEQRGPVMQELKLQEKRFRVLWERPLLGKVTPLPKPKQMSELPPEVKAFIQDKLMPRLTDQEKKELAAAENRWPELPRLVAKLAERHPILPPGPKGEFKHWHTLPKAVQRQLEHEKNKGEASKIPWKLQGKWPEFARGIVQAIKSEGKLKRPRVALGASKPGEFPAEVQAFLRDRLFPALNRQERDNLFWLEGRWPEYPLQLLRLARKHQMVIPGMSLPGPPELWASAAVALFRLPDEERQVLDLIAIDPRRDVEGFRQAFHGSPGWGFRPMQGKKRPGKR